MLRWHKNLFALSEEDIRRIPEPGGRNFLREMTIPIIFLLIIWIVHIFQEASGINLRFLGIHPGHVDGLKGILFSPLLHGSWEHLFANSTSFIILSIAVFWFYPGIAFPSFLLLYVLSGIGTWLIGGRDTWHIGASGILYGMVSMLFWLGVFRRNVRAIILSLLTLMLYAGFFEGIFPGKEGISWEGHLSGAIAGILVAFLFRKKVEEEEVEEEIVFPEEEKKYFLDRDVFQKRRGEEY